MTTKHDTHCKMAFGRKDKTCKRCQELLNGAPAIKWNIRESNDARPCREIAEHDCKKSGCGPVCTFGQW